MNLATEKSSVMRQSPSEKNKQVSHCHRQYNHIVASTQKFLKMIIIWKRASKWGFFLHPKYLNQLFWGICAVNLISEQILLTILLYDHSVEVPQTYQHPDFSYTTAWDNGLNCKSTSFSYTFYVCLDIGFYDRFKSHFWKGKLAKPWMSMPSVAKQCHHANFLFKIQFFNPFYHAASLCTRMY